MKRYFAETNGENMVIYVDDNNRAYAFGDQAFDEPLTLDIAKAADYGNCDGCDTAEEIAACVGVGEAFDWIPEEWERDEITITEF